MNERERALTRQVEELKRQLAAEMEIARAARVGCQAAKAKASVQCDEALNRVALMRQQKVAAMVALSEAQKHTGQVYGRLRQAGDLVTVWQKELPGEFVASVRALTEPDFAELLGVPA